MDKYRLTLKAEAEVDEICAHALSQFGPRIAQQYVFGLRERIEALADGRIQGQDFGSVRPGLHRFEYLSHSIYYQMSDKGVLVLRVVGNKQDPATSI